MSSYKKYSKTVETKTKINSNLELFQDLPNKKYEIIYLDPPWDYGGKLQFDRSSLKEHNQNYKKNIFVSSASFHYPTLKIKEMKTLEINKISGDNCLMFMWTTGPHMALAIELGESWGFKYKTMAFVWDKQNHNPGHYTLSSTEYVLVFKKGKIPSPRGARNIRQLISEKRKHHSAKPLEVHKRISEMFPSQKKIELFSRKKVKGWDVWGLDVD